MRPRCRPSSIPGSILLACLLVALGASACGGSSEGSGGEVDAADTLASADTSATGDTGDLGDTGSTAIAPCLELLEPVLRVGAELDQSVEGSLTVRDCEPGPHEGLVVTSLALEPGSDPAFGLDPAASPVDTAVGPYDRLPLTFGFKPTRLGPATATLAIGYRALAGGDEQVLRVELAGDGVGEACTRLVATVRVVEDAAGLPVDGAPTTDLVHTGAATLEVAVEGVSQITGRGLAEARWSVVAAPRGFSLGFVPSAQVPQALIAAHLLGDYVFEVTGIDSSGLAACAPARVTARIEPADDLVVELLWDTPSDPDETDACFGCGTDLDLHLLNGAADAFWGDKFGGGGTGGSDCHFSNVNPTWGDPQSPRDDARVTRDDTDGGGPEVITIESPAPTDGSAGLDGYERPYLVGVYFYDAAGLAPPVHARINLYTMRDPVPTATWPSTAPEGRALQVADPSLQRSGDFWVAGAIDWTATGPALTELDEVLDGMPGEDEDPWMPFPQLP